MSQDAIELGRYAGETLFSRMAGDQVVPLKLVPRGPGEIQASAKVCPSHGFSDRTDQR